MNVFFTFWKGKYIRTRAIVAFFIKQLYCTTSDVLANPKMYGM